MATQEAHPAVIGVQRPGIETCKCGCGCSVSRHCEGCPGPYIEDLAPPAPRQSDQTTAFREYLKHYELINEIIAKTTDDYLDADEDDCKGD